MILSMFNPEITLGNVIQVAVIIGSAIVFWQQLRLEIALLKANLAHTDKRIELMETRLQHLENKGAKA